MTVIEAAKKLCDACDAVEAGFDFLLEEVVRAANERKLKSTDGRSIGVTKEEMDVILRSRDELRQAIAATPPSVEPDSGV